VELARAVVSTVMENSMTEDAAGTTILSTPPSPSILGPATAPLTPTISARELTGPQPLANVHRRAATILDPQGKITRHERRSSTGVEHHPVWGSCRWMWDDWEDMQAMYRYVWDRIHYRASHTLKFAGLLHYDVFEQVP